MRTFENYHNVYLYVEPLTDDDPDLKKRYQISNTLKYLENYLNITTNQYNRIVENRTNLYLYPNSSKALHQHLVIFFGDIHFLLIAVEKSYLLSFELLDLLDCQELHHSEERSETFQSIKHMRNNLEHMNENLTCHDSRYNRCIEERGWYTNWFDRQWSGMTGNTIGLGKHSFSICEDSFTPLWDLYDNILSVIEEKYVLPNKETVDRIFSGHIKKWN